MIICIGREFGSGGHEIGAKLAERLGMRFYDQELVERAMGRSMLSMEKLQEADERRANPFLSITAWKNRNCGGYPRMTSCLRCRAKPYGNWRKRAASLWGGAPIIS